MSEGFKMRIKTADGEVIEWHAALYNPHELWLECNKKGRILEIRVNGEWEVYNG